MGTWEDERSSNQVPWLNSERRELSVGSQAGNPSDLVAGCRSGGPRQTLAKQTSMPECLEPLVQGALQLQLCSFASEYAALKKKPVKSISLSESMQITIY